MLRLKKMNEIEFDAFYTLSQSNYIQDKMRANGLSFEEAQKIAKMDFDRYLPSGLLSPDNFLFYLMSGEGHVGHLWYVTRGSELNKKAFVADIFLNESARGKGYGRAAMTLLIEQAVAQDCKSIGLHVFGFNEVAIHLYKKLGFEVTDLMMEKSLS